jgi:hypothetical protein
MKVKEIRKILEQYAADTDIFVLESHRSNGAGKLLNLLNIKESTDQDTNKVRLYIETEEKMYLAKFEREEEYSCQTEKEVNNLTSD